MPVPHLRRRRALAPALAILAASCGGAKAPPARGGFTPAPVLLVATDGMEWNAVLPLLRQGRMPTLARLMRAGSYGLLETRAHFNSPALWTSVATGKSIEKHGILDFVKAQRPIVFYDSTDRRTKAFWNILSERGRRVHVLGWFVTYPVEAINGVMVAQTNTKESLRADRPKKGSLQAGLERQVHPPEMEDDFFEIARQADRDAPAMLAELAGTTFRALPAEHRRRLDKVAWALRADAIYRRIAKRLLEARPSPDVLAIYLGSLDVTAHQFWPWAPPGRGPLRGTNEAQARALGRHFSPGSFTDRFFGHFYWPLLEPGSVPGLGPIVSRAYERFDGHLGEIIALLPRETTVIVMSDHGFRPWGHDDGPPALIVAAGPNVRRMRGPAPERLTRSRLQVLGSTLDLTPTLLTLFEIPVGLDMDGQVMESLLQPSVPERARPVPVATHDTPEWLRARGAAAGRPAAADEERLEQLRSLGYIR